MAVSETSGIQLTASSLAHHFLTKKVPVKLYVRQQGGVCICCKAPWAGREEVRFYCGHTDCEKYKRGISNPNYYRCAICAEATKADGLKADLPEEYTGCRNEKLCNFWLETGDLTSGCFAQRMSKLSDVKGHNKRWLKDMQRNNPGGWF